MRFDSVERRMDRRPCFIQPGQTPADRAPCSSLRPPTAEEITAHEQWVRGRIELLGIVMLGILPWREAHKGRSAAEVIECPACKGRLHLSIAASNGHVHARCETQGCASWME